MTDHPAYASAQVESTSVDRLFRVPISIPPGVGQDLDSVVQFRIANSGTLEESARCLFLLLTGGYSVWEDGRLIEIRGLVHQIHGLKISIYSREHGPPHFHVIAPGINASFAIADCRPLEGHLAGRELSLVRYWHASARSTLVAAWNASRPTDCPVGPI